MKNQPQDVLKFFQIQFSINTVVYSIVKAKNVIHDIRYSEENKGAQNLANTIGQQVCLW